MRTGLSLTLFISSLAFQLPAQTAGKEQQVPRTDHAPRIDGTLDDEAWSHAAVLDHWVQTKPGDNTAPHGPTVAYLTYDRTALYIAIRAKDEPGKIRARLHERDNVVMQSQDWIGVSIQLGWSTLASGDLDHPFRSSARSGLAKVSYLWRL